jgi:LEA14-like dessication related protein
MSDIYLLIFMGNNPVPRLLGLLNILAVNKVTPYWLSIDFAYLVCMKKRFLLGASLLLLFVSCTRIKDPEFRRLDNFGVKKLGFEESVIGFSATYYNPNNFGVTVKEADINVYVDTVYLGKFTQPAEVSVNQVAEFSIPLEGKIGLQKAMKFDLPKLLGKTVTLRAEGSVKVGKVGVYVKKPIRYEGQQKISADLIKNPAGAGF